MEKEERRSKKEDIWRLIEDLTTSGRPTLLEKPLKVLKSICKSDESSLNPTFELVFKQLNRKHSEVRLSAFQLIDHFFNRSHAFRELVVSRFREIVDLTFETESSSRRLPPPTKAREELTKISSASVHSWVRKFGDSYPKLRNGYRFLKEVRKVNFESEQQQRRPSSESAERRNQNVWKERVKRVKEEIDESLTEIGDNIAQINNCLDLLVPTLDEENEEKNDEDDDDDDNSRCHGIVSYSRTIVTVDLNSVTQHRLQITEDNSSVFQNLKDQYLLLNNKFLPLVKKWSVILTKAGTDLTPEIPDLLKKSIDIKETLENLGSRIRNLELDKLFKRLSKDESDEEDDFIEVEMEPTRTFVPRTTPPAPSSSSSSSKVDVPNHHFSTEEQIRKYKETQLNSVTKSKVMIDSDKHRFWASASSRDEDVIEVPDIGVRAIELSGNFEPVKWSCRAPLPSGRLCPRKDRFKCPLHGKIIAREEKTGKPANPEEAPPEMPEPVPEWQNPVLLREIKAATGLDLKIGKKKRERKKKYPGLTDLKSYSTTKKRLEKKLFSKKALKRIVNERIKPGKMDFSQ